MPPHARRGSTPTKRGPASPHSPTKVLRYDAFSSDSGSLPSSPRRKRENGGNDTKAAQIQHMTHRTYQTDREFNHEPEFEDPHDLAFNARHIPRASMVDNLVLSLDQLAPPSKNRSYLGQKRGPRSNGHNGSSSISSDKDVNHLSPLSAITVPQRPARVSSAKNAIDQRLVPSPFGDEEISTRSRSHDVPREGNLTKTHKTRARKDTTDSKGSGNNSSIDLGHLKKLQGKLGPAGNRRSQSFDFGSTRPKPFELTDSLGTATIYPTPETHEDSGLSSLQAPVIARRNSTRSNKSAHGHKAKPNNIGTSTLRNNTPTALPQVQNNSAANIQPDKMSPTVETNEAAIGSRPGLFKRFFGSSKAPLSSSNPSSPFATVSARPSQDVKEMRPITPPVRPHKLSSKEANTEANKENVHPTVVKKSSFFRRRKKSVSNTAPPPVPLTLGPNVGTDPKTDATSPVSSLKAFMDPYLANDISARGQHGRDNSSTSFYASAQSSAGTGVTATDKPQRSKGHTETYVISNTKTSPVNQPSQLQIPQKETFLADSSSAEDLQKDRNERNATKSPTTSRSPSDQKVGNDISRNISTSSTIRQVFDTQGSLQPDRPGLPLRKGSLSPVEREVSIDASLPRGGQPMTHSNLSGSDVSEYRSAPSTPMIPDIRERTKSPTVHVSHPSISQGPTNKEAEKAKKIFDNGEDLIDGINAATWLGESGSERERIRSAYVDLFDWTNNNILSALRSLCSRVALKGESQLIDRILFAFAQRWCQCNPNHGFKSADVVHTICYSILLLNTDLHLADIGQKMTRSQFIKNAMQTIRPVAADAGKPGNRMLAVRSNSYGTPSTSRTSVDKDGRNSSALAQRPSDKLSRTESGGVETTSGTSGPLVEAPFSGSEAGWETQIEAVLKEFYFSIQREPLPLFGSDNNGRSQTLTTNSGLLSLGGLRRTPSTISKAQSDTNRGRNTAETKSLGARWTSKARSRPRLGSTPGFGSSKTSLEDGSSAFSPSISSTWSKASLGKTLTSMSVDSFGIEGNRKGDYQSSIGFANALSQSIIREDQLEMQQEEGIKAVPLLEDESLELEGAPWAKEGIVKHKCHLEGVEKRSKDRNWNDCFAVIEKGWMRLFSFSMTAKSLRNKARSQKAGAVVGGGNWQDNAEEVWKFMLRHTIASTLPPPGYSKQRPHVWALSLPTGAVHLFSVGTPDIVKEFVSTVNFWSARLSKEPMMGGVSSMEYGWSDSVINRALTAPDLRPSFSGTNDRRPSTQMSVRSSIDQGANMRPKLPGDRIHISDWSPPQQSLLASQLLEVDQLRALQTYVQNVEEDLQKHNELRGAMNLAFTPKHFNHAKAMSNWEKKSSYLLREIVKFRTYIDTLQTAQATKERIYKMRQEGEEARRAHDEAMAMFGRESPGGALFA